MSVDYRLAVIKSPDGLLAVAEKSGVMAPLHLLLNEEQPMRDLALLLECWADNAPKIAAAVAAGGALFQSSGLKTADVDFASPFARPGSFICIGANYHDHVAEMPVPMTPTYPFGFIKPVRNTLRASGEPVVAPSHVKMMDWEAELGAVIGKEAKNVKAQDALDYVAGYVNFNDLSARDWIADRPGVGIDWVRHKAHDGFAPVGPYFVSAEFIADPQDLPVWLEVNGEVKQNSTTGQMIYGVAEIIEHLTSIMTLYPGDIIATGTPSGVGHGRKPPEYLEQGDVVQMEIGPLGRLITPIV